MFRNSRNMTESGPLDMIDDEDSDKEEISLPGVIKGIMKYHEIS